MMITKLLFFDGQQNSTEFPQKRTVLIARVSFCFFLLSSFFFASLLLMTHFAHQDSWSPFWQPWMERKPRLLTSDLIVRVWLDTFLKVSLRTCPPWSGWAARIYGCWNVRGTKWPTAAANSCYVWCWCPPACYRHPKCTSSACRPHYRPFPIR